MGRVGGHSLNSRAVIYALGAGVLAVCVVLWVNSDPLSDASGVVRALAIGAGCALLSWASAKRALAGFTAAIDVATVRIAEAARGDLSSATPPQVVQSLPLLSGALDRMFAQVRTSLDSATTLALYDPVTALPNRTHFRDAAERATLAVPEGRMSALAFIDLDQFKAVNDTLGHAGGDQALVKVANRLRKIAAGETMRSADGYGEALVGRYAGDEFAMFFPCVTGRDDAARIGDALLASLTRPFEIGGQQVVVGASVGIALSPDHGTTLTMLMRAADVAMYHAKASGRGQYQFFAERLAERMAKRTQLEIELRDAVTRAEFAIVFQPQVSLGDGRVLAAEGLLRWNHPTEGLRLPASFIPCAEESGLIADIGDWAIEALAQHVARWTVDPLAPRIAVNLSPRQISRPDFFTRLWAALHRVDADISLIEFEIEEAVLMQCATPVLNQFRRLRHHGATIAIDDFGSGASSLARLRSLPFDAVKLDASLIAGIDSDPAARDVIQAVIGLVHSLGARAIAEGVETQGQYDMLRVMGCDAAQGYAIAAPMLEENYRTWAGDQAGRARNRIRA